MQYDLPHICFVAPNVYPMLSNDTESQVVGGAELQQVIIAKGLVERGYQVSMVCQDFGQPDEIEVGGITVYRTFRETDGLPGLRFIWPRLTSIWSCLKRIDADIYYQRAAGMLTGVVAAYSRCYGKKSVFAVAGDPMIRFWRDTRIYEYGIKNVDFVVVQNEDQRRHMAQKFGRKSVLVPSCYEPPSQRNSSAAGHVLWVSMIKQLKRPELFVRLAEALPQYSFTMVGGTGAGEDALYRRISSSARKVPNLRFAGFVPYVDIDEYFDNAVLLVNTSDTEGFPNTFLQSWARGLPTVSFVDSGARLDGQTVGRVVESMQGLVSAVTELLEDEDMRASEGEMCRIYVEKTHAPEVILDLYESIFQKLLPQKRG